MPTNAQASTPPAPTDRDVLQLPEASWDELKAQDARKEARELRCLRGVLDPKTGMLEVDPETGEARRDVLPPAESAARLARGQRRPSARVVPQAICPRGAPGRFTR